MELDVKTLNSVIIAGVPAIIVAIGGLWTARTITRGIERMKLDSQETLERQRLEFQQSLERERMEFQRESEAQKQRMELYKTIYVERVEAAKQVAKLSNAFSYESMRWYVSERTGESCLTIEEIETMNSDLYSYLHTNRWLLSKPVYDIGMNLAYEVRGLYDAEHQHYDQVDTKYTHECRERLSEAISNMMMDFDVSSIVFPK